MRVLLFGLLALVFITIWRADTNTEDDDDDV